MTLAPLFACLLLGFLSQPATRPTTAPSSSAPVVASAVAEAHGQEAIPPNSVFHGRLTVTFGGQAMIDDAELWFHPNGAIVRLRKGDAVAVFDGMTAWASPEDAFPQPRFQLLTWPYFAVAPFKLEDAGAKIAPMTAAALDGEADAPSRRARLSFDAGTGDAPDDWYVLYVNDEDQLEAMAYIVTYGTPTAEAEKEPHVIVYRNYQPVPGPDGEPTGVILSDSWEFYNWSAEEGKSGEPIGTATIEGLRLIDAPEGIFDKPEGAVEVKAPGAE